MKHTKRRWFLPTLAVLAAALVGADVLMYSFVRPPVSVSVPITAPAGQPLGLSDVMNSTISDPAFGGNNIIAFQNGHLTGPVYYGKGNMIVADATETADILTGTGQSASGDLNGDGVPDLAIVVNETTGGTGSYDYLVVFADQGGAPHFQDSALLGDRIRLDSVSIADGVVSADIVTQGPNEPMCCGTLHKTLSFKLRYGKLELVSDSAAIRAATPDPTHQGWLSYADPSLKYSLMYPPDFTVSIETDAGTGGPVVVFSPRSEVYFPESDASRIADSRGLRVSVDDNAEACGALPADDPRITVGALDTDAGEFTTIASGDAGMSQYYYSTDYYIVHNGLCFKLDYTTHQTNPGVYDWTPEQVNRAREGALRDLDALKAVVGEMIKTFSFTM